MNFLEALPKECFNAICLNLQPSDLSNLTVCSKPLGELCGPTNDELWYPLFSRRLWTVKPTSIIPSLLNKEKTQEDRDTSTSCSAADTKHDWKAFYQVMIRAERENQRLLNELRFSDFGASLERHFVGAPFGTGLHGWDTRYCVWSSENDCFAVYTGALRRRCLAHIPIRHNCQVKRLSPDEQISFGATHGYDGQNPVVDPRPYVFFITETSLPILWACNSEEQLRDWIDKILVTQHNMKHREQTYRPPAIYLFKKDANNDT